MDKGAPSTAKILTMVLFALSCAGLLLFLWLSFGGTVPFESEGYRVQVAFPNADQLATQADVRIAGVSVGRVVALKLDPQGNRTMATLELDRKYAPIHQNARAILRQKTIIGETYVEITPGTPNAKPVPDGGVLPRGQVQNAVQLDQVFNALDPTTRHAFQVWQQQLSKALAGNDQNLNNVLGNLPTFAADATDILRVLDVEHASVVRLIRNGGTVFQAIGQDPATLRNLITSGETTFAATAAVQNALADTFHVFPTFENETKLTMARLKRFALNTDPLIRELNPVAAQLGPTLSAVRALSPDLRRLFTNLGPLITVSQTGLPAIRDVLRGAPPLLNQLGPFLSELNPILQWLGLHQQLTSDFISNGAAGIAAKTTSVGGGGTGHYLRQFSPVGAETLGIYPNRDSNNRGNTYPPPLWLANPENLQKGNFPSWDCNNAGGPVPAKPGPLGPIAGIGSQMACWVAPTLPGAKPGQIPHILKKNYSSK
jgi:phospholipid/cholesterol/gamma-HCH transport system substrate-binding protein